MVDKETKITSIIILAATFIALGIFAFALTFAVIIAGSPRNPFPKEPAVLYLTMFGIGCVIIGGLLLFYIFWRKNK